MDQKSEKPLRLFINPLAGWTDLALKAGQAVLATAHAAAVGSKLGTKFSVIPPEDAPAPKAQEAAKPADSPRKPAPTRKASKAVRIKAVRRTKSSKATAKRRAKR